MYVCVGVNVYVCGACIVCCMISADIAQCNTNVNQVVPTDLCELSTVLIEHSGIVLKILC